MTLANISAKVRELPNTPGGGQAALEVHGWNVSVGVERHDEFSCLLNEVFGHRDATGDCNLQAWTERLTQSVRSLSDPLKIIEVDGAAAASVSRSAKPILEADGVRYFELLLRKGDSFRLRRYEGYQDPHRSRVQIPFAITYESLTRLVQELTHA